MSDFNSLPLVVDRQLPEFVREDYPTFVAFVEAYYGYLKDQNVDISEMRDIDKTIDAFVQQFKKEVAVNLPIVVQDERMLLQHIKDQYLAKGSEGSFKLLFRLLFGKNVELTYPGQSMLIPSDGRWNQEISVFVNVDYGDPENVVGKLVEISSGDRVLSVLIDRKEELIGEVDRVRQVGDNVYEMYLDKRFFGEIKAGDKVRYLDEFQAEILPATTTINITQRGLNFRVGQVFEIKQGNGTGALLKVTEVNNTGGILRAELIKFGIGYIADFALSILSTNSVNAKKQAVVSTATRVTNDTYYDVGSGLITFTTSDKTVTGTNGTDFENEVVVGDHLYVARATDQDEVFVGVVASIDSSSSIELADLPTVSGTGEIYEIFNIRDEGTQQTYYDEATEQEEDASWHRNALGDETQGFEEQGYLNKGDVFVGDGGGGECYGATITSGGSGYTYATATVTGSPDSDGVDAIVGSVTINSAGEVTDVGFSERGSGYTIGSTPTITISGDGAGATATAKISETGGYCDSTFAGTILREFALNSANAQAESDEPAIIEITLGALNRYPGYFETNAGFLSDSIFVQDSFYYQKFSYVLRIDERLSKYKSAVKTMIHPAGMKLFGEFDIANHFNLALALESLVKSLGITLEDDYRDISDDEYYWTLTKAFSDSVTLSDPATAVKKGSYKYFDSAQSIYDGVATHTVSWYPTPVAIDGTHTLNDGSTLDTDTVSLSDSDWVHNTTKALSNTSVTMTDAGWEMSDPDNDGSDSDVGFGKSLSTSYGGMSDSISKIDFTGDGKVLSDTAVVTEDSYFGLPSDPNAGVAKYIEDTSVGSFTNIANIYVNSYNAQDYWTYTEEYEGGLAETTTN